MPSPAGRLEGHLPVAIWEAWRTLEGRDPETNSSCGTGLWGEDLELVD